MNTQIKEIQNAILNGQESLNVNGYLILLPEPQMVGTEYQKKEYARITAEAILNGTHWSCKTAIKVEQATTKEVRQSFSSSKVESYII